jgi:hypothetical protein
MKLDVAGHEFIAAGSPEPDRGIWLPLIGRKRFKFAENSAPDG